LRQRRAVAVGRAERRRDERDGGAGAAAAEGQSGFRRGYQVAVDRSLRGGVSGEASVERLLADLRHQRRADVVCAAVADAALGPGREAVLCGEVDELGRGGVGASRGAGTNFHDFVLPGFFLFFLQVWLTLRHLLLDPACQNHYTITESRRAQLLKLMMLLTPVLLDQLSPLIELKQWLSHVSVTEQVAKSPKPILLETVLEIKEKILQQSGGKWKKIAKEQLPVVFCNDQKTLMEAAQTSVLAQRICTVFLHFFIDFSLSEAYNTDLLEKFEVKKKSTCEQCGKNAIQRCSHCKKVWYCSRSCQVTHWPQHKEACNKTQ
jgi:hypothetical protein